MNTTNPRILSGIVTSDKADKTITVNQGRFAPRNKLLNNFGLK